MGHRILMSLLVASALTPPLALAQAEEEEASGAGETEEAEVMDPPERTGTRVSIPQGGRESAPGETHTVERGDTLWDLSQRYLGNAWYWPKVWSYNPEIANPHWIYPGNVVRFFAAGEEAPSRVETGLGPKPLEMVAEEGDIDPPQDYTNGADLVQVGGKIGYDLKTTQSAVMNGFVTSKELEEAGVIDSSKAESVMLSYPDTVYVRFKRKADARLGDRYLVFHTTQNVRHPTTGQRAGYLTEFLGTLRVVALSDKLVTAQVMDTWQPIHRGDLVGPFGERAPGQVVQRRNEKEVKGLILTALVSDITLYGEHHTVVVDKGSADGVVVGNTFTVQRQTDLGGNVMDVLGSQNANLPAEDVATCIVTEVKERTCNCLLTRSLVEVVAGDKVVMRVNKAPTAQR